MSPPICRAWSLPSYPAVDIESVQEQMPPPMETEREQSPLHQCLVCKRTCYLAKSQFTQLPHLVFRRNCKEEVLQAH